MKKFIPFFAGIFITINSFGQQVFTDFQNADLVIGQPDFTSLLSGFSNSVTYAPSHIAISSKGMLAVAEQAGGSVKIWYTLPETIGEPADVEVGNPDFNTFLPGPSQAYSNSFDGVAWSPDGNKLIASCGLQNRVLIWNSMPGTNAGTNGQPANVVIGQKDFTSTGASANKDKLNGPAGILVTPDGRLLVADMNNNRVMIWNSIPTTNGKEADVVIGQASFNDSEPGAEANQLWAPRGLHMTADGKLLVTNSLSHCIYIFDSIPVTNNESATVVIGQVDFGNSSSGTTEYKMNMPYSAVTMQDGKLAVADYGNNRVLIYNTLPEVNGAKADIVLGQQDFYSSIQFATDGLPDSNNFSGVTDVKADLNGRLWVSGNSMNRVMVFGEQSEETADLRITLDPSDVVLCERSDIVYKISLFNEGPDSAFNVVVTAAFPLGYSLENSSTEYGSYFPGSGYWRIPFVAPGEQGVLYLDGYVNAKTKTLPYTSFAGITGSSVTDPDLSNNAARTSVTIQSIKLPKDPVVYDAMICEGERAMLFASASGTIYWYPEDEWFQWMAKGLSYYTDTLYESVTYYVKSHDVCPGNARVPIAVDVKNPFSLSETVYICSGSSYTFPDGTIRNNITSPVMHVSNLSTVYGCDSSITTSVNVWPVYHLADSANICSGDSYTFHDGTTQNNIMSTVVHNSNFITILGCDSIITTTVNVYPLYNLTESVAVCIGDSYTFPDGTVQNNITGTVVHTSNLITTEGCDSTILTTVNVYPLYNLTESVAVCSGDSYTFPDGTTFDNIISDTVHTSSLISTAGCDSIVVTTLLVNAVSENTTESFTVCSGDSYTFPDGTTFDNIISDTLHTSSFINMEGCDSIVITTLIVNAVYDNIVESVTVCSGDSYMFPDGTIENNITSPKSYDSHLLSITGCDSLVTTQVTVTTIDATIIQDGALLTATSAGLEYQWVNCSEGYSPIDGETGQSYTATESGNYAVIITSDGCTATSDCYSVIIGVNNLMTTSERDIVIYPNPTSDYVTIDLMQEYNSVELEVLDMQGQFIHKNSYTGLQRSIELDLQQYDEGIYFIRITINNQLLVFRIIKE